MATGQLDQIIQTLWRTERDFMSSLTPLKGESARLNHVFTHGFHEKIIAHFPSGSETGVRGKMIPEADQLRSDGNVLYKAKQYSEALSKYNQSIMIAPVPKTLTTDDDADDESANIALALGFANRSAVMFQKCEYESCLTDIHYSIQAGYPRDQVYKLHDREARCHTALSQWTMAQASLKAALVAMKSSSRLSEEDQLKCRCTFERQLEKLMLKNDKEYIKDTPTKPTKPICVPPVTDGCNTEVPSASRRVSLHQTDSLGKFVTADQPFVPGDVVVNETPYCSVLYEAFHGQFCSGCFVRTPLPYPCRGCSQLVYCSPGCEKTNWIVHKHECTRLDGLSESWVSKIGRVALTAVLSASDDLNTAELLTSHEPLPSAGYTEFCQLVAHDTDRDKHSSFQLVCMSIYLMTFIRHGDYSGQACDKMLCQHLLHALQVVQCNAIAVTIMTFRGSAMDSKFHHSAPEAIGQAIYTTLGRLNHSCDPNTELCFYGNSCVLRVIRPIQTGDHVCIDYGPVFTVQAKQERQQHLKLNYFFCCGCVACCSDWPVFDGINSTKLLFKCQRCRNVLNPKDNNAITCSKCGRTLDVTSSLNELAVCHDGYGAASAQCASGEFEAALPGLQEHLKLMDKLLEQPWKEFYSCQATLKQCYNLIASNYSDNRIRL